MSDDLIYGPGQDHPWHYLPPPRDCPDCEQGKHQGCLVEVLNDDDKWVPCPCGKREHTKKD